MAVGVTPKPKGGKPKRRRAPPPAATPKPQRPAAQGADGRPAPRGTDVWTRVSAAASVVAAVVLAFSLNVIVARHYHRWDMTTGGQFTLSEATLQTLGSLSQPVKLVVLLSKDDPLGVTVDEMLESYSERSPTLEIERIDPDRDQAKLLEAQKRYGVLAGEKGGRVVTDTAIVAVAGDRHHYVHGDDLVRIEDADDFRARPRLEQAITGAIRSVLAREKAKVCFTAGHEEPALDVAVTGFAELKERLAKNNFEVVTVFDKTDERPRSLEGCALLVLAGPRAPVPPEHVQAMRSYIEAGGDALLVVGPVPNPEQTDWIALGVDDVVATAGVKVERDLVFERDPSMRPARGDGEASFPKVETHPATRRLAVEQDRGVAPLVFLAASVRDLGTSLKPEPLLRTSDKAIGVMDFWRRAETRDLRPTPDDHTGPLSLATATERPALPGQRRGARVVVIAAISPVMGGNWREPDHYGTTLFVEGAITWLTEHEAFLDIPDKPLVQSGIRLTEESLSSIFRYVVLVIPAMVLLPGAYVLYRRRRRPAAKEKDALA